MARAENNKNRTQFTREEEWIPRTNLGHLVKRGRITSLDQIFQSSLRIQEPEIVEHLLGKVNLKEETISIKSVQKQSKAGQKTSMKAVVIVGNQNGYIGIGTHTSRELSVALKGALSKAKMNIIQVRMGQWDGNDGTKHTVAVMSSGNCGSVNIKVIPAPLGTGIQVSEVHRKIFELAGLKDVYVKSSGRTKTTENMAKATVKALERSSNMFIPEQWETTEKVVNPILKNLDFLNQFEKVGF